MNLSFFKSESQAFPRCEHRSPSGRQCSQPVCTADPRFCGTHKPTPDQLTTAELTEAAGTLSTPREIHTFLTAVTLNRVRGRITPKEACVYSYLCQNLLRSLREIDHFHELHSEREERNRPRPELLWHLPRPDRSDPPEPSTTNSVVVHAAAASTESPAATAAPVSASTTSTPSDATSAATTPSKPPFSITPPTPNPPFDPSHFYPLDPTLPRGVQDHSRSIPPPDQAECRRLAARRGLLFNRRPAPSGAFR